MSLFVWWLDVDNELVVVYEGAWDPREVDIMEPNRRDLEPMGQILRLTYHRESKSRGVPYLMMPKDLPFPQYDWDEEACGGIERPIPDTKSPSSPHQL